MHVNYAYAQKYKSNQQQSTSLILFSIYVEFYLLIFLSSACPTSYQYYLADYHNKNVNDKYTNVYILAIIQFDELLIICLLFNFECDIQKFFCENSVNSLPINSSKANTANINCCQQKSSKVSKQEDLNISLEEF